MYFNIIEGLKVMDRNTISSSARDKKRAQSINITGISFVDQTKTAHIDHLFHMTFGCIE